MSGGPIDAIALADEREMPSFDKSPAELVARFVAVAARHPAATRKPMFGYPALFVGGDYATGLPGRLERQMKVRGQIPPVVWFWGEHNVHGLNTF